MLARFLHSCYCCLLLLSAFAQQLQHIPYCSPCSAMSDGHALESLCASFELGYHGQQALTLARRKQGNS
jgi:hypothetical protein